MYNIQLDEFIKELKESGMDFTSFKKYVIKNKLKVYNELFERRLMETPKGSFIGPQLKEDAYIKVKRAISYKADKSCVCRKLSYF